MNKHIVLAIIGGWLIAVVFPPSRVLAMFSSKSS